MMQYILIVKITISVKIAKRTISDMILKNKANEIPMNRIYEYKKGLASMVYTVFEKTGL